MRKLVSLLLFACTLVAARAENRNVLMIVVDDLRPELGAYGSPVKTPHMDALAAQGLIFDRAYCNVPVCGASRASFLTGIRPGRHHFINYHSRADRDAPLAVPMNQFFQENGYYTAAFGKVFHNRRDFEQYWDEIDSPHTPGTWRNYLNPDNLKMDETAGQRGPAFEIYEGEKAYKDELLADMTIAKLEELARGEEPFFLATGFVKPHLPFNAPKEYWDLYDRAAISVPETYRRDPDIPGAAYHNFGELRHYSGVPPGKILPEDYAKKLIHGYYASTTYVDAQVGRVLDKLDELGLREDTIVILWGDHGYNLGEHSLWCKHCNFHHALRVPMILDVPGKPNGQRTDAIVEFVDVYPTLAELTGLEPPAEQLQGHSMVPLLDDPNQAWKRFAVSKYRAGISLITDRFLYTEWQRRNGKPYAKMLFDLHEDPLETENLANDEAYADLLPIFHRTLTENWGPYFESGPPK